MRGKIADKQRLLHIIDAIAEIEDYVQNANVDIFNRNKMMQFACIKQIEIIGEAANNITSETKDKITTVNWKQIIGMRHILVHEYFGIRTNLIWQVITDEIPDLKSKIVAVIDTL